MKTVNITNSLIHQLSEIGFAEQTLDHPCLPGLFRAELNHKVRSCIEATACLSQNTLLRVVCYGTYQVIPSNIYVGFEFKFSVNTGRFTLHKIFIAHHSRATSCLVELSRLSFDAFLIKRAMINLIKNSLLHEHSKRQYTLLLMLEKIVQNLIRFGYFHNIDFEPADHSDLPEQLRTLLLPLCSHVADEPVTRFISITTEGTLLSIGMRISIRLNFLCNIYSGHLQLHSITVHKDEPQAMTHTIKGRLLPITSLIPLLQ